MGEFLPKRKAFYICKFLQDKGFEAVFAGGCVRDMILNIEPHDYDVATNATPDDIKNIFKNAKFVGESFGVSLIDGIEVATFRTDGDYSDGRRPDMVEFSTMKEDAKRRDLTMNAMFYDPISEKTIDYFNAIHDIVNGMIRFVGNAKDRINEDYLRMMRAVRFSTKFNMIIVSDDIIKTNAYKIKELSKERILEELIKGLEINPSNYIKKLKEFGILQHILPEVEVLEMSKQDPIWHPEGDVLTHSLMVLENVKSDDWRIKLAALLHDVGKPETQEIYEERISNKGHDKAGAKTTEKICKRLKMSVEDTVFTTALVKDHMKFKDIKHMKKSTLRRFINEPHYEALIDLSRADVLGTGYTGHDMTIIDFAKEMFEVYSGAGNEPAMPTPFVNGKMRKSLLISFSVITPPVKSDLDE